MNVAPIDARARWRCDGGGLYKGSRHGNYPIRRSIRRACNRNGEYDEGDHDRIRPRGNQRRRVESPTASVNSLAMVAEMVVEGASSDADIRWALPMTTSRHGLAERTPKPSMTPPITPTRE